MEINLFNFIWQRGIFLFEILRLRNDTYNTALFGISWLQGYNPSTDKTINMFNFDILFLSFIMGQIKSLFGGKENDESAGIDEY